MIDITLDSLLNFMREHQYEAEIQVDTQQVYTILKIADKEYPLFLRVFDEGYLLQLLVFIPCQMKREVIPDMARLLHLLNKELDLPGFGMDEVAGVIFYRLMLPTNKKQLPANLLETFIKTIENVCQMFAAPIEAVGYGLTTLEEILTKAKELESERK